MRAGPLSNEKVIDLLNHYYIPVTVSHDEYVKKGSKVPAEERAEKKRIVLESWSDPKAPVIRAGEDACYLLSPDGHVYATLFPPDSIKTDRLIAFLEENAKKLKTVRGETLVAPTSQSHAPEAKPDELVLHLTARYIPSGEGWARMPAEDWIVLWPGEWKKLLPPARSRIGDSWSVDEGVALHLLKNFYPPTANTDLAKNRVENYVFRATVVSDIEGVRRVRIDGELVMKHPFFTTGAGPASRVLSTDDDYVVSCGIVGYVDTEPAKEKVRSLRIVTTTGTYAKLNFGVALRSVP